MLLSFNIYLEIVSDSLMPWLEKNKGDENYRAMAGIIGKGLNGDSCGFFGGLALPYREGVQLSSVVAEEIKGLAESALSAEAREMVRQFTALPSTGLKATFYQVLTGYVLGAYFDGVCRMLKKEKSSRLKDFLLTRLFSRLHALIELPVATQGKDEADLLIVFRVKTALGVLFFRINKLYPGNSTGSFFGQSLREGLRVQWENARLNNETCRHLSDLFGKLIVSDPKEKTNTTPMPASVLTPPNPPPAGDESISQLAGSLKQEMGELKTVVEQLAKLRSPGKKTVKEETLMIGSGEVCRLLSISKSTLKRYRDSNTIPFRRIGGKILYPDQEIRKLATAKK